MNFKSLTTNQFPWIWHPTYLCAYSHPDANRHSITLKVYDSNPIHFLSNSDTISSLSASFLFCVCTEKKSSVHKQPWLCKWETNRVARVEPPTQDVKYALAVLHTSVCHNSCSKLMLCLLAKVWRSTEGRGVFIWILSSNINKLSPESHTLHL